MNDIPIYAIVGASGEIAIYSLMRGSDDYYCKLAYARLFLPPKVTNEQAEKKWAELEKGGARCVQVSVEVIV